MAQNAATQFGWNQFALWNDRLSGIELFNREYTKEKLYSFLFRMAREQEKFNISQNNPCYQDVRRVIRTFFFWYLDNTQWNELLAINTISAPPNTENPLMDLPNPLPWADSTTNYSPLWTRQAYGPWDRRKNRSGNRSDPLIVRAPGSWDITVQQNITWAIADHGTALSYLFSVMEEQPSCSPNSRGGPETHIVPALAMYTQMLKLLATDNEHVEGIGYNPEIRRVVDIVNKMPRTTCVIWPRYAHPNAAAIIQLPPIFGATLVGGKKGTETNDYPPKFRDAYGNTGTGAERAALQTTLDNVIRGHARTGLYGKRKATSRRFQNLQQPIANCPGNPGDTNRLPPVPPWVNPEPWRISKPISERIGQINM
ncbi:hypothetical protein DFH27DRAFT_343272 [Peziza echinospora]|nr:hypothetical protein DFH27DRAFT_343272 [Peziza echinospora]